MKVHDSKGSVRRNDFVNDIVNDRALDAIFATLKAIVDDEIVDDIVTCGRAFTLLLCVPTELLICAPPAQTLQRQRLSPLLPVIIIIIIIIILYFRREGTTYILSIVK